MSGQLYVDEKPVAVLINRDYRMQIELIGCTSAGKSTLIKQLLQDACAQNINIILGDDFVLQQLKLHWLDNCLPHGLLVNSVALIGALMSWRKNYKLYRFATQVLRQLPVSWLDKAYMFRNVLKKIGIHEIILFCDRDQQIILVDEGVLQIAHNLFVHVATPVDMENLVTFVDLISLPDVVVYLRQPESLLIDRVMQRGHTRVPEHSYSNVVRFVQQAITTFEQLVQNPAVMRKLLVVDGGKQVVIDAKDSDDMICVLVSDLLRTGLVGGSAVQYRPRYENAMG